MINDTAKIKYIQVLFRKAASAEGQYKQFSLLCKYFYPCYIFTLLFLNFFKESQSCCEVIYSTGDFILFRGLGIAFYHQTYLLLGTMDSLRYPSCAFGILRTALLVSSYKYLNLEY